jgi:uncharacterized membrane protein YccC
MSISVNASNHLSTYTVVHAITMALACLISYWVMTALLNPLVAKDDDLLGGMWAAIASAFVFRDTGQATLLAGACRLVATFVSFTLCLIYLWFAKPSTWGMALILTVGTLMMVLLHRRDEIITTGITTIVVMVVSILNPADALNQPLLRLIDTVVGLSVGVACNSAAVFVFRRSGHGA